MTDASYRHGIIEVTVKVARTARQDCPQDSGPAKSTH
jgi:hypothetical protein